MIAINYISKVYNVFRSKNLSGNHELKIFPKSSSYEQFYKLVYETTSGNKKTKTCTAIALSKMLFFIHFSNALGIYEIPSYILKDNITANKNYLCKYRKMLGFTKSDEELSLLDEDTRMKEENNIRLNILSMNRRWYQENNLYKSISNYHINFDSNNFDISSDTYKELTFIVKRDEDFNNYMDKISKYCLFEYDNFNPTYKFSEEEFLKQYSRLIWYTELANGETVVDEYKTSLSIEHPAHFKGNRFYHPFHFTPSEIRKTLVKLDNELLVPAYDVHNAYSCFISVLLDRSVPAKEANQYEERALAGKIYEDLMEHILYKFGKKWDRDTAKAAMNIYYTSTYSQLYNSHNVPKKNHSFATEVDDFFETYYPNIKKFILKKNKTPESRSKFIREKEALETRIMVHGICKRLYEEYHILGLTLHDGIYLKEGDMNKLKEYNINIEHMFNEYITLKHFIL